MVLLPHKSKIELEPTVLLHRRSYRETSLLLELLTHSHGRVAVIAKGARKAKGKTGLLQPFQLLLCSWVATSELGTLTHVELANTQLKLSSLPSSWQSKLSGSELYCGLYINELILRCTQRGHEVEGLLQQYCKTVEELSNGNNEAAVLREFEWSLINCLGYGASLSVDNNNQQIAAESYYHYLPETGLLLTLKDAPLAISGRSILEFEQNNWHNESILNDARKLTSQALKPLVGDKPFSSRSLYLGFKKLHRK